MSLLYFFWYEILPFFLPALSLWVVSYARESPETGSNIDVNAPITVKLLHDPQPQHYWQSATLSISLFSSTLSTTDQSTSLVTKPLSVLYFSFSTDKHFLLIFLKKSCRNIFKLKLKKKMNTHSLEKVAWKILIFIFHAKILYGLSHYFLVRKLPNIALSYFKWAIQNNFRTLIILKMSFYFIYNILWQYNVMLQLRPNYIKEFEADWLLQVNRFI